LTTVNRRLRRLATKRTWQTHSRPAELQTHFHLPTPGSGRQAQRPQKMHSICDLSVLSLSGTHALFCITLRPPNNSFAWKKHTMLNAHPISKTSGWRNRD